MAVFENDPHLPCRQTCGGNGRAMERSKYIHIHISPVSTDTCRYEIEDMSELQNAEVVAGVSAIIASDVNVLLS